MSNALVPPLISALAPMRLLRRFVLSRYAQTQAKMDQLLTPEYYDISLKMANAIKTLALGTHLLLARTLPAPFPSRPA